MADTRLTLRQAAAALGVSESAIRKRVERGTLRSDKGSDGKRYVYLDTGADNVSDTGADTSTIHERGALISELRAHNDTLREQLESERQAHAEARRIIAGLVERLPAIEAPQEASEASETVNEEPERAEPRLRTAVRQDAAVRPSVDDPPRLRWHVAGVILSMLAATCGYFLSTRFVPRYYPGTFLDYLSLGLLILPVLVIPTFFGFRLGRKGRSVMFWRHLVPIGALIGLGSFLAVGVAEALEELPTIQAAFFFHNFWVYFNVEGALVLSSTTALVYISAAVLGNAIQRQNRERLVEQRPAGFPPESASAAQRWTPQQQAIVGLAGTILSALIGLIGTILTVMASGNGG